MRFLIGLSFALVFILGAVAGQDCLCVLEQTSVTPEEYSWDCTNKGLIEVPINCFSQQSSGVTELILSTNQIETIRTIDLFALPDLRFLYLDNNRLTFFDPSALDGVNKIEYLHLEYNIHSGSSLQFEPDVLLNQPELKRFISIGAGLTEMPVFFDSPQLNRLDARSNYLTTLPRPLFSTIESDDFILLLSGNEIRDVAADILLPLPDNSTLNFDDGINIWAADAVEMEIFAAKNFVINANFIHNLYICNDDGLPTDVSMC